MNEDNSDHEMFCRDCLYRLVETGERQCPECGRSYNSDDRTSYCCAPDGDAWGGVDISDRKSVMWGVMAFFIPPLAVALLGLAYGAAMSFGVPEHGLLVIGILGLVQLGVSVKLGSTFILGHVRILGISGILIVVWLLGSIGVLAGVVSATVWITDNF